jgi:hypothetical protein
VSDEAVERTLASVGHLLDIRANGWTVFHNSFRLFILAKPPMKFGKPDPNFDGEIYARLAELSLVAEPPSPQRWLELRYRSRAGQHDTVLALATGERFRQELADGRPDDEILLDLRLAFKAAGKAASALEVFRLLLARDEIQRRSQALGYAPTLVDGFLAVGDVESAKAYALSHEKEGFDVVDALLAAGNIEGARAFFDRIEPTATPTGIYANDPIGQRHQVEAWASRVFHFRDIDQILAAITRFTQAAPDHDLNDEGREEYAHALRFAVAQAVIADASSDADSTAIASALKVEDGYLPYLLLQAAERALRLGQRERAKQLYVEVAAHPGFLDVANGYRRRMAVALSMLGDRDTARSVFATLQAPGVATMKGTTGDERALEIATAMAEHAQLAAFLGEEPGFPLAEGVVLTPLQNHLAASGALLGRARAGDDITSGEVVRATKTALAYLNHVKAPGSSEFYAVHQLAAAAPSLVRTLIIAAWGAGEAEFQAVLAEFDHAFAQDGQNAARLNIRREVALEAFFCDGDQAAAAARLEPIATALPEQTPEGQVDLLATLATAFARIGDSDRASALLAQVHDHTLGYATAAKKDPQYALWRDLMVNANKVDPENRPARVKLLTRVVRGMMDTEGRDSGYRIAAELLTEAAHGGAALGLAVARALAEAGAISWNALVTAILTGTVRRKPELAAACTVLLSKLGLPYYEEPHHRAGALGDFIADAVALAPIGELDNVIGALLPGLETDSRADIRAGHLDRLYEAVALRQAPAKPLQDARARWRAEAPPVVKRYTPGAYDDVTTLAALQAAFEASVAASDDGKPNYDGTSAFRRLVESAPDLPLAKAMFEQWPLLQEDNHARFGLVQAAITAGDLDLARSLTADYEEAGDPWGSWSRWFGGGRLRYFRARVAIEGAPARAEALADLCASLAAGKESAGNLLADFDTVFPVITDQPDWVAMWAALEEQLQLTREHQLGEALTDPDPISDTELLIAVLRWAISLSQLELSRGVRIAARQLADLEGGPELFADVCEAFLQSGLDDEALLAVQILAGGQFAFAKARLVELVRLVFLGVDFAAAQFAEQILADWGEPFDLPVVPLPLFYGLAFGSTDGVAEKHVPSALRSGAVALDDPLEMTEPFADMIEDLARGPVTPAHFRRRCAMLIDTWGGALAVRQRNDDLQTALTRLDMRLPYIKPSGLVVMRAMRQVVGELRLSGLFDDEELDFLVRTLTYPALGEPDLTPAARPAQLVRPPLTQYDYQASETAWLDGVDDDVAPFEVDGQFVLAEIYRFTRHDLRREMDLQRMRAPVALGGGGPTGARERMPGSIWLDGVQPNDDRPSPTIVRTLQYGQLGTTPALLLTICPHWLGRLSWRRSPLNPLVFLDATGQRVAQVLWWRDGVRQETNEDHYWSDGVVLTVTLSGRRQIEAVSGRLTISARATRSYRNDSHKPLNRRGAEARYA